MRSHNNNKSVEKFCRDGDMYFDPVYSIRVAHVAPNVKVPVRKDDMAKLRYNLNAVLWLCMSGGVDR